MRWLPHNTGYFLILFYTTALVINLMGCIWCVIRHPGHRLLLVSRAGVAHCTAASVIGHCSVVSLVDCRYLTARIERGNTDHPTWLDSVGACSHVGPCLLGTG